MEKAVEIVNRGRTLRGMLHVPNGLCGKIPGIAMYHGYTGNKMESHFIFVKLSRALERAGIASVRFDFACSGESDGDFKDMTPETELSDAKAILDYLRNIECIDLDRIGICGLSMGGYIAGITAGDNAGMVKALCMWAPAGNIKYIFKDGLDNCLKTGDGLVDIGALELNRKAYEIASRIDHIGRTKAYKGKTCIIHGTSDTSVPSKFVEEYRDNMKNVEFHNIDGADHTFTAIRWENEVIDITSEFFKKEL